MEKNICPLHQIVFSLIEITSLVKSSSPLDQLIILRQIFNIFLSSKVCIIEFLFPSFHFINVSSTKESAIRCLEFTFIWLERLVNTGPYSFASLYILFLNIFVETERVNSVGVGEEFFPLWIILYVFPSCV